MEVIDSRHLARKIALGTLFAWAFLSKETAIDRLFSDEIFEDQLVDQNLCSELISGVQTNVVKLDSIIAESALEWPIEKIAKIDLVCLRIAVFELAYLKETPPKVAIDEAVELAKEFGNENSSKFINGVLGTVLEKLNQK